MRFEDLCWLDVDEYLHADNRVILVLGSTEQHAYLSLLTGMLVPDALAQAVAERAGALVAPSLNFGVSGPFTDFPGTLGLSRVTFDAVVSELVESLLHQGFRRLLIINGNRGNRLPQRVRDLEMDGYIRLAWFDWWCGSAVAQVEAAHGLQMDHGNWGENFAFTRVRECPEGEKPPVNLDAVDAQGLRERLGDGSYGGPYQVPAEVQQALLTALVDEAYGLLMAL